MTTELPGVKDNAEAIAWVDEELSLFFRPGWRLLAGGMETVRSPFLLLTHPEHGPVFLLERRNDDGEWDALAYRVTEEFDPADGGSVLRAASRFGEYAQEDDPVEIGLIDDEADTEYMSDLLFAYRSRVAPNALN